MKKFFILALILLLAFAIFVEAKEDDGGEGKGIKNPFERIINKLIEIKDILLEMLTQVEIIAEKNMSVNVEVTPNITLPEKECKWGNITKVINVDISDVDTYAFILPIDTEYNEIKFVNMILNIRSAGSGGSYWQGCYFYLNGERCGEATAGKIGTDFISCPQLLKHGTNILSITPSSHRVCSIRDMYLEMQVKPANC